MKAGERFEFFNTGDWSAATAVAKMQGLEPNVTARTHPSGRNDKFYLAGTWVKSVALQ